jgi:hypothetical protein
VPTSSGNNNKAHADPTTVPDPGSATPSPDPTPDPKPATSPEAGVDAAPVVGKYCQELSTCCDDLKSAGYDTTICKSVLSTNNEDACYTKHASYKSDGDCT